MSDDELPGRVRRAFSDHGSFERGRESDAEEERAAVWTSITTPFDGEVSVDTVDDGRIGFEVTVIVPTLSATAADDVADVVEDGWYETFELRVVDVGGVTRGDHAFDPEVEREGDEIVVTFSFTEINERRGVDDAGALINFVEGTYVQGVIPGYEYVEPVSELIADAKRQGSTDR